MYKIILVGKTSTSTNAREFHSNMRDSRYLLCPLIIGSDLHSNDPTEFECVISTLCLWIILIQISSCFHVSPSID